MSNTKHTPGPWTADGCQVHANGKYLLAASTGSNSLEENCANAKLIAAAPELLEALKSAYDYIGVANTVAGTHIRAKLQSAIKKATE